jgi:acetyl coenzyme A synthetase (ADP forming)-like protein
MTMTSIETMPARVSGTTPSGSAGRTPASLRPILAPRSVAVIGASQAPGAIGHQVLQNLIHDGFTGAVYPVHPRARAICGVHASARVGDLPEVPDVAIVCVPRAHVLDVAEQCGEAGVRGLVVITAGFREVGGEGVDLEARLVEIVRRHGMRLVGPNCMGVLNTHPDIRMNGTFAPGMLPPGGAAFVSQSGALGVSVLDYAREFGIGIAQFVSVGNKPDVSGNDLLECWEADPEIRSILMYVENFGNPRRFLEIASRITRRIPIIAVKSGRSRAGARAASSHTGALAASDSAVDALLAQAGVLRAESIEALFDMAMAFEVRTLPRSRRTAIVTNAGGPGILTADAMDAAHLDVVELSTGTVDVLRPLFPPEASIRNPIDMIASANADGYRAAVSALLRDPHVDAVVPVYIPPLGQTQQEIAAAIVDAAATRPDKPVVALLMGRRGLPEGRAELQAAGIPAYVFPESAARALDTLNRHREWIERAVEPDAPPCVDSAAARAIIESATREGRTRLDELEALRLLEAYGIPTARASFAASPDDAMREAEACGYPVVMKVMSRDISHKSDVGGVRTSLANAEKVRGAYAGIMRQVAARAPGARVDGVLVQRMASGGREVIIGMARDADFGPLMMFGLGGIFVEVLRDVVFRIAPLDTRTAAEMVHGIRGRAALGAVRGQPGASVPAIADAIRRAAMLAMECPEIQEFDVNPLLALEDGVIALDARVTLGAPAASAAASATAG